LLAKQGVRAKKGMIQAQGCAKPAWMAGESAFESLLNF